MGVMLPNLTEVDIHNDGSTFPRLTVNNLSFKDVQLKADCFAISGVSDKSCGVVFRYQDEGNYYIARAQVLRNNMAIYKVVNGQRSFLKMPDGTDAKIGMTSDTADQFTWKHIEVTMKGDDIEAFYGNLKDASDTTPYASVVKLSDTTFPTPGRIGLWTKSDSNTAYDNLEATCLENGGDDKGSH
jgi:hypothetical protein